MSQKQRSSNTKYRDSSSKLIFEDPTLCAQFLQGYLDIPLLRNVQPEDIEDVTGRYVHLFTEERNSDVVEKVHIPSGKTPFYLISLIEHKSKVDYNVVMQVFRYMIFIWKDYEKRWKQDASEYLLDIVTQLIEVMLRKIHVPENEIQEFSEQIADDQEEPLEYAICPCRDNQLQQEKP